MSTPEAPLGRDKAPRWIRHFGIGSYQAYLHRARQIRGEKDFAKS